jgi:hypothetical protein
MASSASVRNSGRDGPTTCDQGERAECRLPGADYGQTWLGKYSYVRGARGDRGSARALLARAFR